MSQAVLRKILLSAAAFSLYLGSVCSAAGSQFPSEPRARQVLEAEPQVRGAPSTLPALGDPSSESLSQITERKLGESIMRDFRRSQAGDEDPDVLAYLDTLGRRLIEASKSGQDFEFFLVRDSSLNAFALPGGFIGVHAGLIAAAETESELAGVLSH